MKQIVYQDWSGVGVDEVFVVSDEQIPENSGFVKVAEADHVLDALNGGRVHRLDAAFRR